MKIVANHFIQRPWPRAAAAAAAASLVIEKQRNRHKVKKKGGQKVTKQSATARNGERK